MKILVSQKINGIAGSENYLLNLLPGLRESGIAADFLILYNKENEQNTLKFEEKLKQYGIKVFKQVLNKIPTFKQLRRINELIKENNYDLVHSNLLFADFTLAACKFFFNRKLKLVSGKHGYEERYNSLYGFDSSKKKINTYWIIARIAELGMNKSYAISKGLFNLYSGLGICKKENLQIIPYGFDFDASYKIRENLRFGENQLIIVGRLTGFKGHRFAFEALKILKEKYKQLVTLVVVGWGELELELKEMVKLLGIEKQVVFEGFKPNPRDYMATSDIVLLPSVSEGFGIVLLEAMSVKKPIIAFDVPSPNEILINKRTGLLVEPYNVGKLAKTINGLLSKPEQREEIAQNAYEELMTKYTLDKMINATIHFYEEVCNDMT